jgi:hypothetical protein
MWANGGGMPPLDQVRRVAAVLKVRPDEIDFPAGAVFLTHDVWYSLTVRRKGRAYVAQLHSHETDDRTFNHVADTARQWEVAGASKATAIQNFQKRLSDAIDSEYAYRTS